MSSSPPASRSKAFAARRTNTLGWAKTDCHSCSNLRQTCDRQRPQCGTCQREGRKCGGFIMNLVWKDHSLGDTSTFTRAMTASSDLTPSKRLFRFTQGRSKRKRRKCKSSGAGADIAASLREWKLPGSNPTTFEEKGRWPEAMNEEAAVKANFATEEYGTLFEQNEQSNAGSCCLPRFGVLI